MSEDNKALILGNNNPATLREKNSKKLDKWLTGNKEMKEADASYKRSFGHSMFDAEKAPFLKEGFSFLAARKKLRESMREADASSAFNQVLRAGVQNIANQSYKAVATTFEDWVTVVNSSKVEELYAPLHGIGFPREVGPSMKYPEVGAAGLDIKLRNRKYGTMYPVELELLEDDQTGQFQQQAGLLGEYMKLLTDVLCEAKLASVASMQYLDNQFSTSETKPSTEANYPWAAASAPFVGGGYNKPASFAAFSQTAITAGIIALMGQKNLLGILMNVNVNRIKVSTLYRFDAAVLLNSSYYPSGAAAAGSTGGAFAINPIQAVADLTVSRYVFDQTGVVNPASKAWYLMDASKPFFVLQMREAASVIQENPQSGASFELDQYRFKVRGRMNADWIDPRFAWQGNDGSV